MSRTCKVTVNKETFTAKCGDLLLDGAIANGVDLPHDCRSGICGSCKVRVEEGKVFGGQDGDSGMIYACQARVVSDVKVLVEPVPDTVEVSSEIANLVRLAPDVFGVDLKLQKRLRYLPGQYCKVQFRGYPARCFSPTYPLQGAPRDRLFHFHLRVVQGGRVTSALGRDIRVGHRVKLLGPLRQRVLPAEAPRPRRDRRQRHRLCADVVGRDRSDQGRAAARTHLHRDVARRCSRSTCTRRCAGWPGSRACRSSRSCPSRKPLQPPFAADVRPNTCRN